MPIYAHICPNGHPFEVAKPVARVAESEICPECGTPCGPDCRNYQAVACGTKLCTKCRTEKPVAEFAKNRAHPDGLFQWCRGCAAVVRNAWRDRSAAMISDYTNKYRCTMRGHLSMVLLSARARAKATGRPFDITLDFLCDLYDRQRGKCAVSGVPMTSIKGKGKVTTNASIDQIEPKRGYTKENVQLACWSVNIMKNTLTMPELLEMCVLVLDENARKEASL